MKKRSSDPTAPTAEPMTGTPGKAIGLGGGIALFVSGLVLGFGSGTFLALDAPPWLDRPGTTSCPSCSCAAAEQSSQGEACEPALAKLRADFEEFQQKGLADLTAKLKEDAKRQAKKGKKQKRQKAQAQPTTSTRKGRSAKDAAREAALSGKEPPKQQKGKTGPGAQKPKGKKKVRRKQKKGGMTRASVVAASKQLYKKRRAASHAAAQEAEPSKADSAMGEEARKIVSFEKIQEEIGTEPEEEARADITEACSQNNLSKNKLQEALQQESASVRRELEHLDIIASYEEATR